MPTHHSANIFSPQYVPNKVKMQGEKNTVSNSPLSNFGVLVQYGAVVWLWYHRGGLKPVITGIGARHSHLSASHAAVKPTTDVHTHDRLSL